MASNNPAEDTFYVEERAGAHYVRGSRIPLDALAFLWREGQSAEAIRDAYPTLRLAEIYGGLAYYLEHQAEIDRELAESAALFETQRAAAEAAEPERYAELRARFAAAREHQSAS